MSDTTEVQRFNFIVWPETAVQENTNGAYVRATDYDALAAKLTECEARLEKAVAFIEIVEKCGNGPLWDLARATLKEIKGQNDD